MLVEIDKVREILSHYSIGSLTTVMIKEELDRLEEEGKIAQKYTDNGICPYCGGEWAKSYSTSVE
jgi:hypothetical protein